MNPSPTAQIIKYVGLDVHAQTIAVAIAHEGGDVVSYGTIPAHSHSIDRLHKKLTEGGAQVRYVYEAGPTGFWLARHLRGKKITCEIVSPSLVPRKSGDRVKTDRRDALTLARLYRAGELSFVHVPDEADEAMRDLVRTRLRAVEDLRRCRQRIKGYLLRYGRRYDGRSAWTAEHLNYLSRQKFDHPGQQLAFEELLNAVADPAQRIQRLTQAIEAQVATWSRRPLPQPPQLVTSLHTERPGRGALKFYSVTHPWLANVATPPMRSRVVLLCGYVAGRHLATCGRSRLSAGS